MTTTKMLMSIGLLTLVASNALMAEERLRPGQWEIVFTGETPHTSTVCLTAAMTQGVNGTAETVRADTEKTASARKYTVRDYKFDGTTLSYTAVGGERVFVNTATYHGDSFESHIITRVGGKELITHQKGRRIGACP